MKRQPNFEILRTLMMFFIVVWHFIVHGILNYKAEGSQTLLDMSSMPAIFNYLSTEYIMYIAGVAVNCYVLISGYFLVKSDFKWNKIAKVWLQTAFYSFAICAFLQVTGVLHFSIKNIINSLFPIRIYAYWFVSMYIALLALSPFLAKLALSLGKKEYQIGLIVFSIISLTLNIDFPYGHIYSNGADLIWFIYLFFVAGYIRLYNPFEKFSRSFGKHFLFFCFILLCFSTLEISIKYIWKGEMPSYFKTVYNGYTFFSSVLLFLWAKHHTFKDNGISRFIVKIAPYTFGVYLIHDNFYIRNLLWNNWLSPIQHIDSWGFIPYMIVISFIIFSVCVFTDYLRSKLFSILHLNEYFEKGIKLIFSKGKKIKGSHSLNTTSYPNKS